MPSGLRSRVPAKITSDIWLPRSDLALCSPRTQLTPSRMFDLPQPFGPTTPAIPVPETVNSVRSQKLLKPRMWIFFNFSIVSPKPEGRLYIGPLRFPQGPSAGRATKTAPVNLPRKPAPQTYLD